MKDWRRSTRRRTIDTTSVRHDTSIVDLVPIQIITSKSKYY